MNEGATARGQQWWDAVKPEVCDSIITSRLLILQSKRLIMNSCERRIAEGGHDRLKTRLVELDRETAAAQHSYRSAVLDYGRTDHKDYWLIAYTRLIERGRSVCDKMREAIVDLPLDERYQLSADVEMVEQMVAGWTLSMRDAMVAATP